MTEQPMLDPSHDRDRAVARLTPGRLRPILGALVGAAAGYAYYVLLGCDSG